MNAVTPAPSICAFTAGADPRFHHVTVTATHALSSAGEVRSLLNAAYAALPPGAVPIHGKVFAAGDGAGPIRAALEGLATPMTLVMDEPCIGGLLAGVQLLAVEGTAQCDPIVVDGRAAGRLVAFDGVRVLHLCGLGTATNPRSSHLERLFEGAEIQVRQQGFSFRDVARTWIYVDALLDEYAELNRIRNQFFVREGIGGPPGSPPPASTGIQGAHPSGTPAFMDLVAVQGAGHAEPMQTSHQCEAYDYGSAFSRGMIVRLPGQRLLYASGTASIDAQGRTVHVGDPRAQILESYAAMDTLLHHQGARLTDAVTAVLFFKDRPTLRAWKELRARGEVPELPAVQVFADVCRSDLLFELEVTAATGAVVRRR